MLFRSGMMPGVIAGTFGGGFLAGWLDPRLLTVYDASPLGQMATGTTVTLTYYIPFAIIEPTPDETTQQ